MIHDVGECSLDAIGVPNVPVNIFVSQWMRTASTSTPISKAGGVEAYGLQLHASQGRRL